MAPKTISITLAIAAMALIAPQWLCGLWMAAKGATAEGKAFQRKLGIGASAAALLTAGSAIVLAAL